jgi:8-oxo-dGTP pyrophosphatase MutT (NUDIX family)
VTAYLQPVCPHCKKEIDIVFILDCAIRELEEETGGDNNG